MRTWIRLTIVALAGLMLTAEGALAITLTHSPASVRRTDAITFTINGQFTVPTTKVNARTMINLNPKARYEVVGNCRGPRCELTYKADAPYAKAGTYAVRAKMELATAVNNSLLPPNPAIDTVTVCPRLAFPKRYELDEMTVGVPYEHQLEPLSDGQKLTFRVVRGRLPDGLTMDRDGLISGTPTSQDRFDFTVEVTDQCPNLPVQHRFGARGLGLPPIEVSVSPEEINLQQSRPGTYTLTYTATTEAEGPLMITSTSGRLAAGNTLLRNIARRVNITLTGGRGTATETVTLDKATVQRMLRSGSRTMTLARDFQYDRTRVGQTATLFRSMGRYTGGIHINWLKLRFDNGRPEITVKRDTKKLRAYCDFTYDGSGFLRGHWEVDGRIYAPINRNLRYTRQTVTLESPELPGLPTFQVGTHRVRLVIDSPVQSFETPVALYFVTAQETEIRTTIGLAGPADGIQMAFRPADFTWQAVEGASAYLVEFFDRDSEEVAFSAQTKGAVYHLPQPLLMNWFAAGQGYSWRVTGLDEAGEPMSQSGRWRFYMFPVD